MKRHAVETRKRGRKERGKTKNQIWPDEDIK